MKKLRVAVIGYGRSGRDIHCAHLKNDDRFELVAVVDELEYRRALAASEHGCETLCDYRELFGRNDIDFVVNASYSQFHAPISFDLLRHDFNVLSEKPIAPNTEVFNQLVKADAESNGDLMPFLQSRYRAQFQKVLEIARSGVLGRIVNVKVAVNGYARRWDWQTLQCNTAGSLYNTGPHPVGHALEFFGDYDEVPNVFCKMDCVNTFGDAEDYVLLILTRPNKPVVEVEISSCNAFCGYSFQVHGDRGSLSADQKTVRWKYFDEKEAPQQHLTRESLRFEDGSPRYCGEQLPWHEESWDVVNVMDNVFSADTYCLYTDIYNHLANGEPLRVTLKQLGVQVAVMEEAHRQNPLPVKY